MSAGTLSAATVSWRRVRLERRGDDDVGGQHDGAAGIRGGEHDLLCRLLKIGLVQRLADRDALRGEERVRHAAADDERIDLPDQVSEKLELGGDLCAADDGDDRMRVGLPSA